MGWMAPLRHLSAKLLSDRISSEWEPSMSEVTTIGLDLAKHVFQVHGVDAEGATVLRKQLRRAQVLTFFSRLPPCLVGLEACATAHYWARELRGLGHEVRLMPAQYVKAYVKRNKNDAADAAAPTSASRSASTARAAHQRRRSARLALLHQPRASRRRSGRSAQRPLQPRRHVLRDADRPAPVPRQHGHRDHPVPPQRSDSGAAAGAEPLPAPLDGLLAKDPHERFPSAASALAELARMKV